MSTNSSLQNDSCNDFHALSSDDGGSNGPLDLPAEDSTVPTNHNDDDGTNPANVHAHHSTKWYKNPQQLSAMISNFSTSYNVVNISLALVILEDVIQDLLPDSSSTTTSSEDAAASASALLAGMIFGQLIGGALGDIPALGRLGALRLVMSVQIIASLATACIILPQLDTDTTTITSTAYSLTGDDSTSSRVQLLEDADSDSNAEAITRFYMTLAVWRFVLGVGAGGVYPLAAVLSAEQGPADKPPRNPVPTRSNNDDHDENSDAQSLRPADDSNDDQIHRVVQTFSTQGIGFIAVPLVAIALLSVTSDLNLVWRLLLAFGCVPGLVLMILQWSIYRSTHPRNHQIVPVHEERDHVRDEENTTAVAIAPPNLSQESPPDGLAKTNCAEGDGIMRDLASNDDSAATQLPRNNHTMEPDHSSQHRSGFWDTIRHEPDLFRKLIGTAGTWFLFDVFFYGNALFQPIVVEAAFGHSTSGTSSVMQTAMQSLLLTSIALPGYFVSSMVLGSTPSTGDTGSSHPKSCCTQTPRYVMLQGFAAVAVLYFTIGWNWNYLRQVPILLVVLYGMTFFFSNYGPNTTTFILPSLVYSPECRSTLNGISAAAGKLGALCGATLFEPVADRFGDDTVMLICSALAIIAVGITYCTVPKQRAD